MEKRYKIHVNETLEYELSAQEIESLDVSEVSSTQFHILKDHRSFKAQIVKADFIKRSYSIKVNSNSYEISIFNELDLLIEQMGLSLGSSRPLNDLIAPMPGLILDVKVQAGDQVRAGEYLLVLEAMKMENTLTAPRDGVVKSVAVKKGQSVEKNQLLIEIEAPQE